MKLNYLCISLGVFLAIVGVLLSLTASPLYEPLFFQTLSAAYLSLGFLLRFIRLKKWLIVVSIAVVLDCYSIFDTFQRMMLGAAC
jgi:hypothetical protein